MSSLVLSGDTSGSITVAAPAVAGSNTQTLVATTGTLAPIVSGTAVASTSGTSIDFTGIPSWVKRITVMFNGVSTNGTSPVLLRSGSGTIETTGYSSASVDLVNATAVFARNDTSGFSLYSPSAAYLVSGNVVLTLQTSSTNTWTVSGAMGRSDGAAGMFNGGSKAFSGVIDRIRITTVNGTDTFDAGSINILYE